MTAHTGQTTTRIACPRCGYPDGTALHACNPPGVAEAAALARMGQPGSDARIERLSLRFVQAVSEERAAQEAVYAAEDTLIPIERRLEMLRAGAVVATQDGRNEEVRKALTAGMLEGDNDYQATLHDADQLRPNVRQLRLELTVAQRMRELAFESLRLERARLTAMGAP